MTHDHFGFEEVPIEPGPSPKPNGGGKTESKARPFKFWRIADMRKLKPPEYIVDKVLQAGTQNVIFAPSGHYKTMTALDLIVAIAYNRTWHGITVKSCPVIYVANEDAYTFARQRVLGHLDFYRLTEERLIVIPGDVSLSNPEVVARLIVTAEEAFPGEPVGYVFDTWERTLGADSDKSAEVIPAVDRLDELLAKGARFVITLSHSPWSNPERTKGAVPYWASQSGRMKTERDQVTGNGTFDLVHQKNGPSGLHLEFEYQQHAFEIDGEMCTTLIPQRLYDAPTSAPPKAEPKPGHGGVQKIMLAEMVTLARRHPDGRVEEADLKSAFIGSYHAQRIADGKKGLQPQDYTSKFINTLKALLERGDIRRLDAEDADQVSGTLVMS